MEESKNRKTGVSLRTVHIWIIVVTVIMTGVMIFFTFRLASNFKRITEATELHMELEEAAHDLMDASDYLTERVQRFTLNGDRRFLDEYFAEAFEVDRRGNAIAKMSVGKDVEAARQKLQNALRDSIALMNREYYAMRLVIEANGYTDFPDVLNGVSLTAEDAALSSEDKMHRATEIVLNDEYYEQKDKIRENMHESLTEIQKLTSGIEATELNRLQKDLNVVRILLIAAIVMVVAVLRITSRLGINPVLLAVDRIKADSPIPEVGANEFRYLAQAYNKMYSVYKDSIDHLNFKASHDELTGAYNRAGYDLLLTGIDQNSTYMLLFDIDNFKQINDVHGHETGDKALIKLVQILKSNFRADDCVCRVGGDEFIVFMVHADEDRTKLIKSKMEQIKRELANTDDGMPLISVSVGVVHGTQADNANDMFEKADAAMYESKRAGKNRCTFYTEN